MTPQQFARMEALFEEACARPPEGRGAWLRAQCADDPEVLHKVEGMLAQDAQSLDGLETPVLGAGFHVGHVDEIEQRIRAEFAAAGRYQILSLLGEGGFGSVYRAEQLEPVRRQVALKVIKLGMDTRRILARFDAERQTLALMNHPSVAKILDAGVTASGRPYFVMELVEGQPITAYCNAARLDPRARLDLFVRVCESVRHAHQKGVLHRDLKPSNVLVTVHDGKPAPIIIDFGIARALNDESGAATLMTEQGQMIGTPEYMSPEQAAGDRDIDTRADIYALGVLLYELLTGSTPLERALADSTGPLELQRLIREQEPPTPSLRVKTLGDRGTRIAQERRADPAGLSRLLRGDLDWIVMRAIEKDRALRYETADAFAADITRYLNDEPVLARPPSAVYRFGKFARRHKGALAAGIAIFILLIGGLIGTGAGMLRAQREAETARNKSAVAQAVSDFLNNDLLSAVAPDELGNDASMRKVVEFAARRVEGKFPGQPLAEAAVHLSLGRTFAKLADLPAAERHLERCLALRRAAPGPDAPETLEAEHELALVYKLQDRNAEAERLLRRAYEGRRRLFGEPHADTISSLYELSVALGEQGRYAETEELMKKALDLSRRHLGEKHVLTLTVLRGVGVLHTTLKQPEKAGPYYEEAYRLSRAALGPEHPTTLLAMHELAVFLVQIDRLAEAEALLTECLAISKRLRGAEHFATLMIMCNLAIARYQLGHADEAETLLKSALEAAVQNLPAGHTTTTLLQLSLAALYDNQKRFALAEPLFLACVEGRQRTLGPSHPLTLEAVAQLAAHYESSGEPQRAAPWIERLRAAEGPATGPAAGHKP